MPLMSHPSSPWDQYPFRQPTSSIHSGSGTQPSSSKTAPQSGGQAKSNGSNPLRDITTTSGTLSGVGLASRNATTSQSTVVNSRGSLGSIGSIGSIGRSSLGSVASMSSSESTPAGGSDSNLSMWHISDEPQPSKSLLMNGSSQVSSTPAAAALLVVAGLPRDLTIRECHFIFALASEFSSLEISKNAVSGDLALHAKFGSIQGAQHVGQLLERRSDLFGSELKLQVQAYSSPFVSQSNTPRSLYPSRPLFADPYWSSQQPSTPLSPSTDIFNQSRRASLVSPTDTVFSPSQLSHINLANSSLQHPSDSAHVSAIGTSSGNISGTHSGSNSSSGSSLGPASGISPTHTGGDRQSPSSLSQSSSIAQSAIGTGAPGTPTLIKQPGQPTQSAQSTQSNQHNQSNQLGHLNQHSHSSQHSPTHSQLPPPNPADQNPPCNTLYVGNLPPDTSEVELKDIFSEQPGYRRLCFRAKQNGPMCFVEFEDEQLAGKALSSLYGFTLSNSVKGGIRLSYSKNPLGVRSRPLRK